MYNPSIQITEKCDRIGTTPDQETNLSKKQRRDKFHIHSGSQVRVYMRVYQVFANKPNSALHITFTLQW